MPCPPFNCDDPACGHAACPSHKMDSPHSCTEPGCECAAYVYPEGVEASQFEGGGGGSGGGGSSGGW